MKNNNLPNSPIAQESLPMSDEVRDHEINELETMLLADSAPEPNYSGSTKSVILKEVISQPENTNTESAENLDDTNETSSKKKRIRSRLSVAVLTLTGLGALDKAGKIVSRLKAGRKAREEKFAVNEDDSHFRRAQKFMGRNALRIAGGTLVGTALVAGAALKIRGGIDMASAPSPLDHDPSNYNVIPMADTRMLVGGHFDKNAAGLDGIMNNLQGHGANNTVRIDYPAEIAPFPGETNTLDESTKIASDKIYNAYKTSNGKSLELIGYSQGTQGVQDAANRIAAENGGVLPNNVKVLLIATPNGESGFFNSPYAQAASPILDGMGIDVNKPIPKGAKVIAMDTDFWANSGDKPVTTMISQLIGLAGDGHNPPVDGMRSTTEIVDGNTYTTYYHNNGPQTAALRVLEQKTDIPVTAAMDKFGQAIAPQGSMGVETNISAPEVIDASADLAKEGLGDRGLLTPEIENGINQLENFTNGQQQPIQQLFDTVQNAPEQILGTITNNQTPSGGGGNVATLPAPVNTEQFVDQANTAVDQVQTIAPPEVQNIIDQTQQQVNATFNDIIGSNFGKR